MTTESTTRPESLRDPDLGFMAIAALSHAVENTDAIYPVTNFIKRNWHHYTQDQRQAIGQAVQSTSIEEISADFWEWIKSSIPLSDNPQGE